MSRKFFIVLLISLFAAVSAFAEFDFSEMDIQIPVVKSVAYFAVAVDGVEGSEIPEGIANNEYYRESIRLTRLATETFQFGDYDASANFAQEAIRFAALSDEYVSTQLIAEAERLKTWADNNNVASRFPNNYQEGVTQYDAAVAFHSEEEWKDSINASTRSIEVFAAFYSGTSPQTAARTGTTTTAYTGRLASQYTVRTWRVERDCLWTIAGYPWVYGDPWRWRELYEANKDRMPEPANPDLILPGMVLDIPARDGENRQGMYRP